MEAINLQDSMKIYRLHRNNDIYKSVMEKVESFITRLRWKAHFFDKKECPVSNITPL